MTRQYQSFHFFINTGLGELSQGTLRLNRSLTSRSGTYTYILDSVHRLYRIPHDSHDPAGRILDGRLHTRLVRLKRQRKESLISFTDPY